MVEVTARQVHRTAIDNHLAEAGNRIAGNDQGQSAAGNRRRSADAHTAAHRYRSPTECKGISRVQGINSLVENEMTSLNLERTYADGRCDIRIAGQIAHLNGAGQDQFLGHGDIAIDQIRLDESEVASCYIQRAVDHIQGSRGIHRSGNIDCRVILQIESAFIGHGLQGSRYVVQVNLRRGAKNSQGTGQLVACIKDGIGLGSHLAEGIAACAGKSSGVDG